MHLGASAHRLMAADIYHGIDILLNPKGVSGKRHNRRGFAAYDIVQIKEKPYSSDKQLKNEKGKKRKRKEEGDKYDVSQVPGKGCIAMMSVPEDQTQRTRLYLMRVSNGQVPVSWTIKGSVDLDP